MACYPEPARQYPPEWRKPMKKPRRKKPNMLAIYGVAVLVDLATVAMVGTGLVILFKWLIP